MTAPRLAILAAAAATLLLAGCTPSAPTTDGSAPPTPTTPAVVSLSDLEFSVDSPDTLDALAAARTDLEDFFAGYTADCTAADAASGEQGDCLEGVLTTLQKVNGVKTVFDFGPWTSADFESGDYSGLTALKPTLTTNQSASDAGSDVIDHCYYVPGGDGCDGEIQDFLDLTAASIDAMQTWER